MFLAGTYELTIDAKNRLSIPFAVRRELTEETDGHAFWLTPGRRPGTLTLIPKKHFEQLRAHRPDDESLSEEAFAYRQWEDSQSVLLDPDAQGRVLIPERLLKAVGIEKEVALVGRGDRLELWHRGRYESFAGEMWADYPTRRARAMDEEKKLLATRRAGGDGSAGSSGS